jgi:hypothetical protein
VEEVLLGRFVIDPEGLTDEEIDKGGDDEGNRDGDPCGGG